MNAIVDAGPLIAFFDRGSDDRQAVRSVFERADLQLIVPVLPLAEACYMLASRFGPDAEMALLRLARLYPVVAPAPEDMDRMIQLVDTYRDFPLGASDASIVALAERLGITTVITFDHRHFRAVRPRHVAAFELLPG